MGGGPKQFGVDAEQVPELLGEIRRAAGFRRLSSLCRFAEPACRIDLRGSTEILRTGAQTGGRCPFAGTLPQSWGRLRHPLLPENRLDLAPIGEKSRAAWRNGRHRKCQTPIWLSNLAAIWSARPEFTSPEWSTARFRGGRLPGCRWRVEPSSLGIGQLRTSHPQELPGRHRQPDGIRRARDRYRGRPLVHAARPARRPDGTGGCPPGRSGSDLPVGRLWRQRQPAWIPWASGASRSHRIVDCRRIAAMHDSPHDTNPCRPLRIAVFPWN